MGQIDQKSGLLSNEVYKIKYRNSKLYLTVNGGFQEYNLSTEVFRKLTKADGLPSDYIQDFEVVGEKIWLVFNNRLLQVEMEISQKNRAVPAIDFFEVKVNDKVLSKLSETNFTYQQNEFEFTFIAHSYGYQGYLNYAYKLEGLNEDWEQNSFENNKIRYPTLPPGQYTFHVKTINKEGIASKVRTFSFVIAFPFWRTFWFYLLCGLTIVAIVSVFFMPVRSTLVRQSFVGVLKD